MDGKKEIIEGEKGYNTAIPTIFYLNLIS